MKKNFLLVSQLKASGNYDVFDLSYVKVYRSLKPVGMPIMEGHWSVYVMSTQTINVDKTRQGKVRH